MKSKMFRAIAFVGFFATATVSIEILHAGHSKTDFLMASTRAVDHQLLDRQEVSPSESPERIVGIAVPVIVNEPIANHVRARGMAMLSASSLKKETPTPVRILETELNPWALPAATSGARLNIGTPTPNAEAASTSFESLNFDDNSANTVGSVFIPSDPIAAAGPDHVVSVINVSMQIHTKTGAPLLDSVAGPPVTGISLASFFSALSPVSFTFDPKVIYDQHAERFVVMTLELQDVSLGDPANRSRILVAVSDDSNPLGTWYQILIDSKVVIGVDSRADFPGLAVDEEAIYTTANMFEFLATGSDFAGNRLWVIDKYSGSGGGFYGGGTSTVNLFNPVPSGGFSGTTQPAHIFGNAPTSPNVGTWLTLFDALTDGTNEYLQVVRFDDPVGPGVPTLVGPIFINLGNIDDLGGSLPDAPQSGTTELVETNSRSTLHSVWRDDLLYVATVIDPEAGDANAGETTAHWVELNATGTTVSLSDQGDIGGEDIATGTHTFFPSIAVNDSGDVAIGFAASAGTIFPSAAYTTHAAAGSAGSNTGSALLRAGLDFYIRTFDVQPCAATPARNRWGDYSGMALDPFDQCFWVYNQYAITRGSGTAGGCNGRPRTEDGRWGTAFGYFCESCRTNLALSDRVVSGTESEEARDRISASTVTVEGPDGDLTLTSNSVTLSDGFTVEKGGKFKVVIGPCS